MQLSDGKTLLGSVFVTLRHHPGRNSRLFCQEHPPAPSQNPACPLQLEAGAGRESLERVLGWEIWVNPKSRGEQGWLQVPAPPGNVCQLLLAQAVSLQLLVLRRLQGAVGRSQSSGSAPAQLPELLSGIGAGNEGGQSLFLAASSAQAHLMLLCSPHPSEHFPKHFCKISLNSSLKISPNTSLNISLSTSLSTSHKISPNTSLNTPLNISQTLL